MLVLYGCHGTDFSMVKNIFHPIRNRLQSDCRNAYNRFPNADSATRQGTKRSFVMMQRFLYLYCFSHHSRFRLIWINSFLFWACFFRPKINLRILRDINYRFTKITKLQTTVDNLDKYNLVLENNSLNYHEMFPGWLWWWCWFLQTIPYLYKCAPGTSTPPWAVSYLITPRAFHDQSDLQTITFVKGYK